ncbi:MAG TPA: fibrobacter succinogenes major paralogous domain-containing protein [Parafilimonas sp.]|nr:fibrobacter succinogenes major paralogous domain-containing protein [Parafilimonas sp.]
MKITFTSCVVLMLLSISWTKQNGSIRSSAIGDENSTQPNNIASITIGSQVWMEKNLDVSRYRNGDKIPQVKDSATWATLTTGAWCWYNNDSSTGVVYGKLYNWYAVHDPRGLAPIGWHVPSDSEWFVVYNFLGTNAHNAGGKMKETGTTHWLDPNVNAINSSGFTAPGGGYRDNLGQFAYLNFLGYWWTSTSNGIRYAFCRRLVSYGGFMDRMSYENGKGFSVRCVKD